MAPFFLLFQFPLWLPYVTSTNECKPTVRCGTEPRNHETTINYYFHFGPKTVMEMIAKWSFADPLSLPVCENGWPEDNLLASGRRNQFLFFCFFFLHSGNAQFVVISLWWIGLYCIVFISISNSVSLQFRLEYRLIGFRCCVCQFQNEPKPVYLYMVKNGLNNVFLILTFG